jgi:glycogen(starch) synthase
MRVKRVLMTTDVVGGVWPYSLELADALSERGARVTLAAFGGPVRPDQREEFRRARAERLHTARFALEWMPDPWDDLERAAEWLLAIRDEVEPDLVHLNGYAHAGAPWGVPVVVVGHSCVLSWFEAVRGTSAPPAWNRYRDVVREGLEAADLLVAPTRAMLSALVRLYDPPCPLRVIPNGRRPSSVRATKEPLIVSVGRLWDEAKNVDALVRVAPRLDWLVTLAGDGSPAAVEPNVTAVGLLPRQALDRLLARASIFALPARYEPFGLAPLEAALAGCALVLGDIPSLREVWGTSALFVDPEDDGELAAALRRLIRDGRLRVRLAGQARRRAAEFTVERMAEAYADAYESVLQRDRAEAVS